MKITLLIMWLIVLILDIICAVSGADPNWVMVFAPLSVLLVRYAIDVAEKYIE